MLTRGLGGATTVVMPQNFRVEIEPMELVFVSLAGSLRNSTAVAKGRRLGSVIRKDHGFDTHVVGMVGEYGFAKRFDRFWTANLGGLDTDTGDVGGAQVKGIDDPQKNLIVPASQSFEFTFVLVYVQIRVKPFFVDLWGWARGEDVRQPELFHKVGSKPWVHEDCYLMPRRDLRAMAELVLADRDGALLPSV